MELVKVIDGTPQLTVDAQEQIAQVVSTMKELKEKEKQFQEQLKEQMELYGIKKIDMDKVVISYVAPSTRETFNAKEFQSDYADLYDQYVEEKEVKSSVRIKVK